jgi:uncharacterized membrane protein
MSGSGRGHHGSHGVVERFKRNVLAGLLAIVPILITIWIVRLVLEFLESAGRPFVIASAAWLRPRAPDLADVLLEPWFQSVLAVLITLCLLYVLGGLTTAVLGRRLFAAFDAVMARIPFVESIYGALRRLIGSFQHAPAGQQRVVLIEFPSPEMKSVGLVTATFHASDTGQELAAVYVPTAPNPTSGYIEIVPVERLVWLDWSTNDAMQFILSGGTIAPEGIRFLPDVVRPHAPARPAALGEHREPVREGATVGR